MNSDRAPRMSPGNVEEKSSTEWTPTNGSSASGVGGTANATPPDESRDHTSPPAKRRREDRERTRVSRACDRCKR